MKYSTVELTADRQKMHERIVERVDGITVTDEETRYLYRSPSGFQLATLTDVREAGRAKSRLRYRTTMISPTASHARNKARDIRRAVEPYVDTP